MAVQQNSLKYFGGKQSGFDPTDRQVVIERTDMSNPFSDDEYNRCRTAVTNGYAVAVNWIQGGVTRQLQLVSVSATGVLKFSYVRGYNLDTWTVTASSPHSITHESYEVDPTNFAPAEYGTNEVHNLPTSITAFRTGDVIPVDGPSGTAKMGKDNLLQTAANYAVNEGIAAKAATTGTITDLNLAVIEGYIDCRDGSVYTLLGNSHCTDFLDLEDYADTAFYINAKGGYYACIYALYDSAKNFIASFGINDGGYITWEGKKINVHGILASYPNAKYIRFSAWPENSGGFGTLFVGTWDVDTIESVRTELITKISKDTQDIADLREEALPTAGTTTDLGLTFTEGEYVNKTDGTFHSITNSTRSDYVDLDNFVGKTFSISAGSGSQVCIYAVYDKDKKFLNSYGKDAPPGQYITWNEHKVTYSSILANDPNAKYIVFSSWPTNLTRALWVGEFENNTTQDEIDRLDSSIDDLKPTTGEVVDLSLVFVDGEYAKSSDGSFTSYSGSKRTDYIDLNDYEGKTFSISGCAGYYTCLCAVYDSSKTFLRSYGKNAGGYITWDFEKVSVATIKSADPSARYIVFSSWPVSTKDLFVGEFVYDTIDELFQKIEAKDTLYGKKWVACGDSYTQATNLGTAGFDPVMGIYKSYAWWIAQRTGCNLVMMAKSGERIHNDPNSTNKFTPDRYKTIPTDADIITLSFGLNEINVDIGDSSSTDNTTLWGAFNEVLGWIMNNIPKAKVGIIIADGWMPTRIADAERAIAEYWCVPCLDLKYDPDVPLGISGDIASVPQVRPNTSSLAQAQRNSVFADQSTHPNADAHEYRSTFIEAWMKTL